MAQLEFGDLVIPASEYDGRSLAQPGASRVGEGSFVLTATALGHMFLELSDGSVSFLDTWSGNLERGCGTVEQFRSVLPTQNFIQDWLMPDLVATLIEAGMHRQPAQCFSPFVSPGIGGTLKPDNFKLFPLHLHLVTSAAQYRAIHGP